MNESSSQFLHIESETIGDIGDSWRIDPAPYDWLVSVILFVSESIECVKTIACILFIFGNSWSQLFGTIRYLAHFHYLYIPDNLLLRSHYTKQWCNFTTLCFCTLCAGRWPEQLVKQYFARSGHCMSSHWEAKVSWDLGPPCSYATGIVCSLFEDKHQNLMIHRFLNVIDWQIIHDFFTLSFSRRTVQVIPRLRQQQVRPVLHLKRMNHPHLQLLLCRRNLNLLWVISNCEYEGCCSGN